MKVKRNEKLSTEVRSRLGEPCLIMELRVTSTQQPLAIVSDGGVVAAGDQRSYVESRPDPCTSPQTVRLSLSAPLSRLKGTTPTRAAIYRRFSVPSSGR